MPGPATGAATTSQEETPHESRADGSLAVEARFLDEEGGPLAGIELRARGGDATRSLPDGTARLALARGWFDGALRFVEAGGSGFAREVRAAQTTPGVGLQLGDWVLVSGGRVEGRVVDSEGRGLGGVRVACAAEPFVEAEWGRERRERLEALARPGVESVTEPDGAFHLDEFPAGEHRIVAVAEDRPAAVTGPLVIPAGALLPDVVVRMEDADGGTTITGIVVDPRGRGVARALVRVNSAGSQNTLLAEEDGRFLLRCTSKEPHDVIASDPEQRLREARCPGVVPGTHDLVLRLSEAPQIELTVRSQAGPPVERFAVAVLSADRETLRFLGQELHPQGRAFLTAPAQDFFVEVRANGWMPVRLGPYVASALPEAIECVLAPAEGLSGRVTAGAEPLGGVGLALHAAVTRSDRTNGFPVRYQDPPVQETESAADGTFALSIEEPGSYWLRAEHAGFAPAEVGPLRLAPDRREDVDVVLGHGGALAIRVHSPTGASVSGVLVACSRGDGHAFTERTDAEGRIDLSGLTPGPWQVELAKQEIVRGQQVTRFGLKEPGTIPSNCRVVEGETTPVDLWLGSTAPCRITGRLTIDGALATGWTVVLEQEGEPVAPPAPLPEPGLFHLDLTEPGRYTLRLLNGSADPERLLVITDTLSVVLGENPWSLAFETGALEGPLVAAGEDEVVFYRWSQGSAETFAPLVPTPEGRMRARFAPAGLGALVRVAGDVPFDEQVPEVLREVRVRPGETSDLDR